MPPTEKHLNTSIERTTRDYSDLHRWIDDPEKKHERHDFTRIWEFAPQVSKTYGEEGVREYIEHLREDMDAKLNKVRMEDSAFEEALDYFGIRKRKDPGAKRKVNIPDADIETLRGAGVSEEDIRHCRKVAEKALEIALRTNASVDVDLVIRGALFHDLGKARTHAIEHGRIGAEMGRELGLPQAVIDIMEKHIRGGLSAEEAAELGLPARDYALRTLEERIIIYADRLVDIITDGIVNLKSEKEAEDRFEEILRRYPRYGKNDRTLARYLGYHEEIQNLTA